MKDTLPDVAVFGVEERYYDRGGRLKSTKRITLSERYFSSRNQLREYVIELEKSTLYGYLWNKLYDAEHIKKHNILIRGTTRLPPISSLTATFLWKLRQ